MPGSTPATSQLDWLSSTTAMIVLFWSRATRDLLKSTFVATTKRKASADAQFPRRQVHRFDDLRIGAAATQIARQVVTDLVVAWVGMRGQQLRRHQHESGRAKAALERTRLDEGFLHRVQRVAIGKALDGDELGAVGEHGEVETARHRRAVDQHGAAAAQPLAQLSRGPPSAKRSRNTSTSVSCGATTHSAAAPFRVKRIVRGAALIVPPATGRLPPGVARGRPPRR